MQWQQPQMPQQQNYVPEQQSQSRVRMAQLPQSYKPYEIQPKYHPCFDKPEICSQEKPYNQFSIDNSRQKRENVNTCRDYETQDQCNNRAYKDNLSIDRMHQRLDRQLPPPPPRLRLDRMPMPGTGSSSY